MYLFRDTLYNDWKFEKHIVPLYEKEWSNIMIFSEKHGLPKVSQSVTWGLYHKTFQTGYLQKMDRFRSKLVFCWLGHTLTWASKDTSLLRSWDFTNLSCFYDTGPWFFCHSSLSFLKRILQTNHLRKVASDFLYNTFLNFISYTWVINKFTLYKSFVSHLGKY